MYYFQIFHHCFKGKPLSCIPVCLPVNPYLWERELLQKAGVFSGNKLLIRSKIFPLKIKPRRHRRQNILTVSSLASVSIFLKPSCTHYFRSMSTNVSFFKYRILMLQAFKIKQKSKSIFLNVLIALCLCVI